MLLVGAFLLAFAVGGESSRFYLVPGALGLIYLAAALAGGRNGSYWATALVLVGFGSAVVIDQRTSLGLASDGLELIGAGLGAVLGALLARKGFAVDVTGAVATIVLVGVVAALRSVVSEVTEVGYYVAFVAIVGLVNVALGAKGLRGEGRRGPAGEATAG